VLELGPGPGAFTVEAARRAGPQGRLIAVDIQPRMIAQVEARVRQGYLENSNVASVSEMVGIIETMRHFEANQKLIQSYDEMLGRAIRTLGEF